MLLNQFEKKYMYCPWALEAKFSGHYIYIFDYIFFFFLKGFSWVQHFCMRPHYLLVFLFSLLSFFFSLGSLLFPRRRLARFFEKAPKSGKNQDPTPHYAILQPDKGWDFQNLSKGSKTLGMASDGLEDIFKGDFADTCAHVNWGTFNTIKHAKLDPHRRELNLLSVFMLSQNF